MADDFIWQEFNCRKSGEGCGGFILVRLNIALNRRITIICPSCKHEHERVINKGLIVDDTHRGKKAQEVFTPLMSAWSKEPRTEEMKVRHRQDNGNAEKLTKDQIEIYENRPTELKESWLQKTAGRLLGKE